MLKQISKFYSILWPNNILLCVYTTFVCALDDKCFFYFHILAVVKNASMNTGVKKCCVWVPGVSSFGYVLNSGIVESGDSIFSVWEKTKVCFQNRHSIWCFQEKCMKARLPPLLHRHLFLPLPLPLPILAGVWLWFAFTWWVMSLYVLSLAYFYLQIHVLLPCLNWGVSVLFLCCILRILCMFWFLIA